MHELTLLALDIESIPYENAVEACLQRLTDAVDTPRPQQLYEIAKILQDNLDTPGKLASIAAMALVMLNEERKRQ